MITSESNTEDEARLLEFSVQAFEVGRPLESGNRSTNACFKSCLTCAAFCAYRYRNALSLR